MNLVAAMAVERGVLQFSAVLLVGCAAGGPPAPIAPTAAADSVRILRLDQSVPPECRMIRNGVEVTDGEVGRGRAAYDGTLERAISNLRNVSASEGANVARITAEHFGLLLHASKGTRGSEVLVVADLYRCPRLSG